MRRHVKFTAHQGTGTPRVCVEVTKIDDALASTVFEVGVSSTSFTISNRDLLAFRRALDEAEHAIPGLIVVLEAAERSPALTDGASVGAGEDETPRELSEGEIEQLASLARGMLISSAADHFRMLRKHGLIEETDVPEDAKSGECWYTITDEGRRVLAETDDGG